MRKTAIKENTKVDGVLDKIINFKKLCKKAKCLLGVMVFTIFFSSASTLYFIVQVIMAEPKTLEYVKAVGDLKFQFLLTLVCILSYGWSRKSIEDDLTKRLNAIEKEFEEVTEEMTI